MRKIIKLLCCALAALTLLTAVSCNDNGGEKSAENIARDFISNMFTLLNEGNYEEYAGLFEKSEEEKQSIVLSYTTASEYFETVYSIDTLEAKLVDDTLLIDLIYLQETKMTATGGSNVIKSEVSYALKQYDGVWRVATYISGESILVSENEGGSESEATAEAG